MLLPFSIDGRYVHFIVECDHAGAVVDVQDASLDIFDVVRVVVDVLGRGLTMVQDVVVVPFFSKSFYAKSKR